MNNIFLAIDQIHDDPDLMRQKQSKVREVAGFSTIKESIRNIGLKEPVVVYKDKDKYFLCDGYSRLNAVRELKESNELPDFLSATSIPCIVAPKEIKNAVRIATDIRQDLLPSQKAEYVKKLYDMQTSREDIAKMCGYSVNTIRNWLLVSRLIKPIQDMMDANRMPVDCAVSISPLTEQGQYYLLDEIEDWKAIRRDDIRGRVNRLPAKYFTLEKATRTALAKKMKPGGVKQKQSLSEKKNLAKNLHKLSIERRFIDQEAKELKAKVTKLVAWIERMFRNREIKSYIQKNHEDVFSDLNTILEVELGRR